MTAYLFRMNNGIAGDITRLSSATVESQLFDSATPFSAYGLPGKLSVNGDFSPFVGAETAADLYGFLVRPYPITGPEASEPVGTDVPPSSGIASILKRGYLTVKVNAGMPVLDGQVYVRVANPLPGQPIGGIEATSDGSNTIAINAYFTGEKDSHNAAEIAFNL